MDTITSTRSYMTFDIWFYGLLIGVLSWGAEAYGFYLLLEWLTGKDLILLCVTVNFLRLIILHISLGK